MKNFEVKKFEVPKLDGISEETIAAHLKLYEGYVKNSNAVLQKIGELSDKAEENSIVLGGLYRRFAFEFGGMRNHEYYFAGFNDGPKGIDPTSPLYGAIATEFGLFDDWLSQFKALAMTRGIGWAMLYYDKRNQRVLNGWVDEHHLNHLADCPIILALDMWEHAYYKDYEPAEKSKYIESFFKNLNWEVIENNFTESRDLSSEA